MADAMHRRRRPDVRTISQEPFEVVAICLYHRGFEGTGDQQQQFQQVLDRFLEDRFPEPCEFEKI